jgi:hypothetical protein
MNCAEYACLYGNSKFYILEITIKKMITGLFEQLGINYLSLLSIVFT